MSNVWVKSGKVMDLPGPTTTAFTADGTGGWVFKDSPNSAFQAVATGTGTIGATITIQCSNDKTHALSTSLGVITLSGTTSVSDGFITQNAPWKYVRAVVSGSSGTDLSVSVNMGV